MKMLASAMADASIDVLKAANRRCPAERQAYLRQAFPFSLPQFITLTEVVLLLPAASRAVTAMVWVPLPAFLLFQL